MSRSSESNPGPLFVREAVRYLARSRPHLDAAVVALGNHRRTWFVDLDRSLIDTTNVAFLLHDPLPEREDRSEAAKQNWKRFKNNRNQVLRAVQRLYPVGIEDCGFEAWEVEKPAAPDAPGGASVLQVFERQAETIYQVVLAVLDAASLPELGESLGALSVGARRG
jgi:hypothetical protein